MRAVLRHMCEPASLEPVVGPVSFAGMGVVKLWNKYEDHRIHRVGSAGAGPGAIVGAPQSTVRATSAYKEM